MAVNAKGDVFIADTYNDVVREVTPQGAISTYAGDGDTGYRGDNGPATRAELSSPTGLASTRSATSTSPTPATTSSAGSRPRG